MLFFVKDLFWKSNEGEGSKVIIRILKIARTLKLYKDSYDVNHEGETDDEHDDMNNLRNRADDDNEVAPIYAGDFAPREKRKKKICPPHLSLLDSSVLSSNNIASHSSSELTRSSNRTISKKRTILEEDIDEIVDYANDTFNQPSQYIRSE